MEVTSLESTESQIMMSLGERLIDDGYFLLFDKSGKDSVRRVLDVDEILVHWMDEELAVPWKRRSEVLDGPDNIDTGVESSFLLPV